MLANGTMRTIQDDKDIYVSLTQLCEYFTQSSVNMKKMIDSEGKKDLEYAQGMMDMMFTVAQEVVELGKFEAQRRLIDTPQDILDMIDKKPFGSVE
jgi:hypothetical protein